MVEPVRKLQEFSNSESISICGKKNYVNLNQETIMSFRTFNPPGRITNVFGPLHNTKVSPFGKILDHFDRDTGLKLGPLGMVKGPNGNDTGLRINSIEPFDMPRRIL